MFPRAFAWLAAPAAAACATAALAQVTPGTSCVGSSISMSLGPYVGDSATPTDSIGSFTVRCTRQGQPQNVPITMGIGPSANSGSIASRQMRQAGGSDVLSYNLYRDALRQSVWGQTAGVDAVTQTAVLPNNSTTTFTFTIYGRINGQQNVFPGSYGDTLVVTISY